MAGHVTRLARQQGSIKCILGPCQGLVIAQWALLMCACWSGAGAMVARGGRHLCMGAIVQWRMVGRQDGEKWGGAAGGALLPQHRVNFNIGHMSAAYQKQSAFIEINWTHILGRVGKMCLQTSFAPSQYEPHTIQQEQKVYYSHTHITSFNKLVNAHIWIPRRHK